MLVGEAWDTFGTIDGKLVRTVALLMTRPGALTVEWLRGRRAPYVSPINLYLTVSAVFFTALAATFGPADVNSLGTTDDQRRRTEFRTKVERKYAGASPPIRVLTFGLARFGADPLAGIRTVLPVFPRIMFVLVPLFAVLLQRAFRGRGWRYPAHLYFALHLFAFYFAVHLIERGVATYGPIWAHTPFNRVVSLVSLAYAVIAMRRVYGGRWWATAARVVAIAGPFYVAVVLGLVVVGVATLGMR